MKKSCLFLVAAIMAAISFSATAAPPALSPVMQACVATTPTATINTAAPEQATSAGQLAIASHAADTLDIVAMDSGERTYPVGPAKLPAASINQMGIHADREAVGRSHI